MNMGRHQRRLQRSRVDAYKCITDWSDKNFDYKIGFGEHFKNNYLEEHGNQKAMQNVVLINPICMVVV